jgi:HEAT repeat protein
MTTKLDDVKALLALLADETQPITFSRLYVLSDLAGQALAEFRQDWATFSDNRRERIIRALVELAEANFAVNFDAIFRYALDDPSAVVRATAVEGLWEDERTDLIGPFLTMLRADPAALVRAAAATSLGRYVLAGEMDQLEAPIQNRIVTELQTVIHQPDEDVQVRRRAIESVAYACLPEIADLLEMAYYDDDDLMRLSAIVGMGRSCDRRWKSIILQELDSDSPAMRFQAAWASGELALHESVPLLARLIDDADREVCNATIWALGQIGGAQAKEILTTFYEAADEDAQLAIEDALAELALSAVELDFPLYELDETEEDLDDEALEEDLILLWSDEGEDDSDDGSWEW